MDSLYDNLFDLKSCDDKYCYNIIPTLSVDSFRNVVEGDLAIINNATFNMAQWTKFKWELLKYEKLAKLNLFTWVPCNPKCPFAGIGIIWTSLENKSTRYFQIHMAFDDIWIQSRMSVSLINVWDVIPDNEDI